MGPWEYQGLFSIVFGNYQDEQEAQEKTNKISGIFIEIYILTLYVILISLNILSPTITLIGFISTIYIFLVTINNLKLIGRENCLSDICN